MTDILSAESARRLMPSLKVLDLAEKASDLIREAAEQDQSSIRLSKVIGPQAIASWFSGPEKPNYIVRLKEVLEGRGYTVKEHYDCGGQFVDMDLFVVWKEG